MSSPHEQAEQAELAPVWEPDPAVADQSILAAFTRWAEREHGIDLPDYDAVWRWSVDHLEDFWLAVWRFFGIQSGQAPGQVVTTMAMPGAEWFPGVSLNYVAHVFRDRDPDATAVLEVTEAGAGTEVSWAELERQVASVAAALRGMGVGSGMRVVGYLPNAAAAIVAFLATASLGAIWSACGPDYAAVPQQPAGPARAARAGLRGRLPLRRARARPPGRGGAAGRAAADDHGRAARSAPGPARTAVRRRRDGDTVGGRHGGLCRAGPAPAGPVRPSVVGAVFVRHHRDPEGDRARARGCDPRLPQGRRAAPEHDRRGPGALVHHPELDDVELPRLGAARGRDRGRPTTAAQRLRRRTSCGRWPPSPRDAPGDQPGIPSGCERQE